MNTATPIKRKKRCDRNHIVYEILSPKGEIYVGIAHVDGTARKSLNRRWLKHVNRAENENKSWALCRAIRQHGADAFSLKILEIVRGKAAAHRREVEWIGKLQPALNSTKNAKKVVDIE